MTSAAGCGKAADHAVLRQPGGAPGTWSNARCGNSPIPARRIGSGLEREQVPAEPQPVQASKFVNPPPAVAPTWFQGRQVETDRLARYLSDPGIRLVTVSGPGGIGKTALVCRLLKGLESGRIPGADGDRASRWAGSST